MVRDRLVRRLHEALEKSRREHPDGPLPAYELLWRLVQRDGGSRLARIARFVVIVAVDLVLLAVWVVGRPFRTMVCSTTGRIALVGSLALVALLMALPARLTPPTPGSRPAPASLASPTIGIRGDGGLTLGGRSLDDEALRRTLGTLAPTDALLRIESTARVGRVQQVTDLLVDSGIRRVRTEFVASGGAG
jgi:hypothetical protein